MAGLWGNVANGRSVIAAGTIGSALLLWSLLIPPDIAQAGKVRTLYTNDQVMPVVSLAMGRSTILRFDEKPKTAVVGNQNYFGIEYLGNDLTIQPLGVTATNLFVYTENQTYGVILKVVGRGTDAYDDLINVHWKPQYTHFEDAGKKKIHLVTGGGLEKHVELKSMLRMELKRVIHSVAHGVSILEGELKNLSQTPIRSSDVQITLIGSDGKKPDQRVVIDGEVLSPRESRRARLIARLERLGASQVSLGFQGQLAKVSLPKEIP